MTDEQAGQDSALEGEPGWLTEELRVVVNDEEQYSVWPVNRELPAGWKDVGLRGTKAECLAHIERVWTDMRPRSLRNWMEQHGG